MTSSCVLCKERFEIHDSDLTYYKKASPIIGGTPFDIPPPTLCQHCRLQRRTSFRNEHTFYRSSCKNCGRAIVSLFNDKGPYTGFCKECWFSDAWDAKEYGRPFDWNRPFFDQFHELNLATPQLTLSVWNSENSDYCSYVGDVKNCYLVFGSVYSEDCYYGSPYYSKNCVDTLVVRNCERCYECIDSRELYDCLWCQDCTHSHGLLFCYDLQGCSDCIGCAGLRKKQYCIFNEQLTKQEYEKRKAEIVLADAKIRTMLRAKLHELSCAIPHRFMQSNSAEDVSGNFVYQSKNVHDAYYADKSHDCRYCAQVVELTDCYDCNYTEENELCYEYLGAYQNTRVHFSLFCNRVQDSLYSNACHRSSSLFGCSGIRDASYCILNQQYTKAEYERTVPKIIAHMRTHGEWGEFFPSHISTFGYNETVAGEYFPLTEDEVRARGWNWNDHLPYATGKETVPWDSIATRSNDVPDSITQEVLGCTGCGRNYRLIPQELEFYRSFGLAIPQSCFDCRHRSRLAKRNPRRLWNRSCAKCKKPIQTTYQPSRPETVYCEACYLKEVY